VVSYGQIEEKHRGAAFISNCGEVSDSSYDPLVKGLSAEGLAWYGCMSSGFRVNIPSTVA